MPNEGVPICGCGVAFDLQGKGKTRNGVTVPIGGKNNCPANSNASKHSLKVAKRDVRDRKNARVSEEVISRQGPANSGSMETAGGTSNSLQMEQRRIIEKHNAKQGTGKRLNTSRRTRSAERPDSHYTYIDSGSSIVGNCSIRDNVIPEALYASINGSPNRNLNPNSTFSAANNQITNGQNNHSQPAVYAIPSMTSPPPTYDVAMWQSGLPPSYEEYLCHKYAVISRSHTPPPPWSDSSTLINNGQQIQSRREILASQPDLREYLSQLAKAHAHVQAQAKSQSQSQNNNHTTSNASRQQQRIARESTSTSTSTASAAAAAAAASAVHNTNFQTSRVDQSAARSQRARTTISRSQSESRARQQRIATMYEDGAFCMETTAIQSAFEHGVAFCSIM